MSTPTPVALSLFPQPLSLITPHERDRVLDHLTTDPWWGQLTPATCTTRLEGVVAFLKACRWRGGVVALAARVDGVLGLTPETTGKVRRSRRIWWPPYDKWIEVPYCYNRVRSVLGGKTSRPGLMMLKAIAGVLMVPLAAVIKHCEWIAQVPAGVHSKRNRPRPLVKKTLGKGPNGGMVRVSGRRVGGR